MANVAVNTNSYSTPKGILMFPDEYQAFPNTFEPTDPTAVTVGTKKIVRAGTIWPANDATAKGVVFYDVDVTGGTGTGAILFEASVKTSKLPVAPATTARTALPRITFFDDLP